MELYRLPLASVPTYIVHPTSGRHVSASLALAPPRCHLGDIVLVNVTSCHLAAWLVHVPPPTPKRVDGGGGTTQPPSDQPPTPWLHPHRRNRVPTLSSLSTTITYYSNTYNL
jgi:hypothetical protein